MTTTTSRPSNGEDEASPSMSRSAEDNLSNSENPLLSSVKRRDNDSLTPARHQMHSAAMLLRQDNWRKSCAVDDDRYTRDEKKSHQCIWMLTVVLAFIGFCNLILNLTILVVLRVSQGMEALEVMPDRNLIKFYGNTDLDRVCLDKGICEGFGDEPIELIGDAAGVQIQVSNRQRNKNWSNLQVLKNGTSVSQVESFQVKDPRSGAPIFSTDFPNFGLPQGVKQIEVGLTQTHRIAAPKKSDLAITSDKNLSLHGAEGTSLDAKDILWTARNDILLHSQNGDIVIEAKGSINMPSLPIAPAHLPNQPNQVQRQYKVCICMPNGKLFLVPTRNTNATCRSVENNPCAS